MELKELRKEYWQDEFNKERKRLGKFWRQLLAETFPEDFNNTEGINKMNAVADKQASLERTAFVVLKLREVKKKLKVKPASPKVPSAKSILKDASSRQQAIKQKKEERIQKLKGKSHRKSIS
ncbi:hypothetical protein [Telluribacter humicola]|uniref:hypothetical protein n=1 Tax=Telluribacter humicola TaxID=1720261 RepID=UPI001A96DBBE|nr:hypothetical protein [Telluribacter humicola]